MVATEFKLSDWLHLLMCTANYDSHQSINVFILRSLFSTAVCLGAMCTIDLKRSHRVAYMLSDVGVFSALGE